MDAITAYSSSVTGRDKLYRLVQYGSKLLAWHMEKRGLNGDSIKILKELERSMSISRKLFRFGRSIESLRAAQRALHLQNYVLSFTLSLSHTNKAFYLLLDHYIWLGKAGLLEVNVKKWSESSYKFWLAALTLAFIRDLYALQVDAERSLQSMKMQHGSDTGRFKLYILAFIEAMKNNPQASLDILKNGFDLIIPTNALGYVNFNNGVVGFCGVMSSIIAAVQVAKPALKLKPN